MSNKKEKKQMCPYCNRELVKNYWTHRLECKRCGYDPLKGKDVQTTLR